MVTRTATFIGAGRVTGRPVALSVRAKPEDGNPVMSITLFPGNGLKAMRRGGDCAPKLYVPVPGGVTEPPGPAEVVIVNLTTANVAQTLWANGPDAVVEYEVCPTASGTATLFFVTVEIVKPVAALTDTGILLEVVYVLKMFPLRFVCGVAWLRDTMLPPVVLTQVFRDQEAAFATNGSEMHSTAAITSHFFSMMFLLSHS
jgi:hypothetical protein